METQILSSASCHIPALLIGRRFVKETLCSRRRSVTVTFCIETFCRGYDFYENVLYTGMCQY
jgi:hypothetical protein